MIDIKGLVHKQRRYFQSNVTRHINFRLENLKRLRRVLENHEKEIFDALHKDLNKSEPEAFLTEFAIVLEELSLTIKKLKSWAKPKRIKTGFIHTGSSGSILYEPYGVALIVSPWNYPFQLTLAPLIGAMAAGNCIIVKPSELTPSVSSVLGRILNQTFSEEYLCVIEGGVEVSSTLLAEKFDYIFFTGSISVGRIVMEAAAKNLTPVTLELGGKSPCIVHNDASLKLAARRIVWGKFLNAGQTCVAPDYLLVHKDIKIKLLDYIVAYINEQFGKNPRNQFPRIINKKSFERLMGYIDNGRVITGGTGDESRLFLAPTILDNISWNDPIMQEEIFGPILPVLEYTDLDDVLDKIGKRPKPLALYIFSTNKDIQKKITTGVSFGGGCINDTIYHIVTPFLPFGGVGESGMGSYHGEASFLTFSHKKSILKQTNLIDIPFRYPTPGNSKILRLILKIKHKFSR